MMSPLTCSSSRATAWRICCMGILARNLPAHARVRITSYNVCYTKLLRNAHDQLALDDAFDIDVVDDLVGAGEYLSAELDLAAAQGPSPTRVSAPAQEEPDP